MYKVLLVDDEVLSIEGLKLAVEWEKLGYEICGICQDGEEAIRQIEKLQPHLVITDIMMPVINGLDLIEHVWKHTEHKVEFVIMSGYSEFEYAKRALQYGVNYYLLKPVFGDELSEILHKISRKFEEEEKLQRSRYGKAKEDCCAIIHELLLGTYSPDESDQMEAFADDLRTVSVWRYVRLENCCSFISHHLKHEAIHIQEQQGEDESLKNIMDQVLRDYFRAYMIECSFYSCGIVMDIRESSQDCKEIECLLLKLRTEIAKAMGIEFYIGVGEAVGNIASIRHSYRTAQQALYYKFFNQRNSVIFYDYIKEKSLSRMLEKLDEVNHVIEALEEMNVSRLIDSLNSMFSYFKSVWLAPEVVRMLVVQIVYHSFAIIRKTNGSPLEVLKKHPVSQWERKITIEEFKDLLTDYCMDCCEYIQRLNQRNLNDTVYKIQEYVKENFKRNLTIVEISKKLYMHPVYLGQLFSRKFGVRLNEYIHQLRIEEAKKLLATTTLKSHEVAAALGYNTYLGFLQHFEKYTGMKPVDYKQRLKS
ncbi:MAG: response regulator [Clostridia bacterium]|nr:response regulator [Clostridia bacterium]